MTCNYSAQPIHIFFFPFPARGHIFPLLETARLFAERDPTNIQCSFISTPANSSFILPTIESAASAGLRLRLLLIPFPSAEAGLPLGVECTESLSSNSDFTVLNRFFHALSILQQPFTDLVVEHRPDCIVSDPIVFWPAGVAHSLSIPHLLFNVCCPYTKCVIENIFSTGAHLSPTGPGSIVGPLVELPHPIELTKPELPFILDVPQTFDVLRDAEEKSCGYLFNCFEELMPEYVQHCRRTMPGSAGVYCVGPVQLHNSVAEWGSSDVAIKNWLDSKPDESVLYVCFGSESSFTGDQLRELALGLARCSHPFIWVVRGGPKLTEEEWMPEEFAAAVRGGRGLMITKWAPQAAILNHRASGGQVLHCGWNSTIEALCAGLPVVAWPLHSEQFVAERLVVEVLKIGVRILEGAEMRSVKPEGKVTVKAEIIKAAVDKLMGGGDEEARAMRMEAKKYPSIARSAMAEGGSSYENLSRVIELIRDQAKQN